MKEYPHRRYNALTGEYVLVSPHRARRPWQGQMEAVPEDERPAYDPACYLCPGNERAGGVHNPPYTDTYAFTNDFPALLETPAPLTAAQHPLLQAEAVQGTCRVLCFSPRHDLTLPRMAEEELRRVIKMWMEQTAELGQRYKWVQVFQNEGAMMGSSNPHPHGQVWALDRLPNEASKEDRQQQGYLAQHGRLLLMDYLHLELEQGERIVVENEGWAAVVPFWAVWPFETLLLPRQPLQRLTDLDEAAHRSLANILRQLLVRYDNLFQVRFPYSMGWHGAPFDAGPQDHWQLHAHFYPPLLRSATVRKFMVGFEMLGEAQRDLTAEQAAAHLRSLPAKHYKEEGV